MKLVDGQERLQTLERFGQIGPQRIGLHQPNIAVECLVVKIFD